MINPCDTGGWLRPDAQAELDALPAETILRYRVLRQTRNLLVHNSVEARTGLADRLGELAGLQSDFDLQQPLTPRVLLSWLNAASARRLRMLLECVPMIWRTKLVAESLVSAPEES